MKPRGDERGDFGGDGLEDDGEGAGGLDGEGVVENFEGAEGGFALDAESAEGVLALRVEADVADDGDAGAGDALDGGGHFGAAFELDALDPAFFDHADGGFEALLRGDFVGSHGKVSDLFWGFSWIPTFFMWLF